MGEDKKRKKLKTFNLDEDVYREFSDHCKDHGISMSKKVENYIKEELSKLNREEKFEPERKYDRKEPASEDHPMGRYC